MNRDFDYGNGRTDNQLRTLEHLGILRVDASVKSPQPDPDQRQTRPANLLSKAPDKLPHLADPADTAQSLDARARSYLHANCAHCHVEAGGGNASVDLDFATPPANTKMFDQPAQSNLLAVADAKLIATSRPEKPILLHRIATRGPGQMPPIGSNVVDQRGAKLIEEWIRKMPASTQPAR
jgi:mono/diheme cytochrome c family protein